MLQKFHLDLLTPVMDKERETIRIFMKNFGMADTHMEFMTDAEVFRPGKRDLLFSTDAFSSEDNFRSCHPGDLGWNLAVATLSDIFAAGGIPRYYGHAVIIQSDWDERFIEHFSKGIASCLQQVGADFIGGDLGISEKWSYTGIAIGTKEADICRNGARPGDYIYMTGQIGSGNLEAALKLYSDKAFLKPWLNMFRIRFALRYREAALVRKYASSCMDSSDGVFRALQDLTSLSGTGFFLRDLVYIPNGLKACRWLGTPPEILFTGECGEYELVFTVSPPKERAFLTAAESSGLVFHKLGLVTESKEYIVENKNERLNLSGYDVFARNFPDVKEYIEKAINFIKRGKER